MKISRTLSILVAVTALVSLSPSICQAQPKQFVAAGSGVNLEITRILANAFMKDHEGVSISVPGSIGTKGAISAVADKAVMIGLISRPLKENEQRPLYTVTPYGKTPVVIGVNPSVPENGITSKELTEIYGGKKLTWSNGHDIVVQMREAYDSGFQIVEAAVPGFAAACDEARKTEKWTTYFTDQDANEAIAKFADSIGVSDLGMILSERRAIKPLSFDGVEPTVANISDGTYKLSRTLYFLTRADNLSEDAKAFMAFVRSDKGQAILNKHGYLPL
ncbi:MAG: substrate-binding domain-containing protein [Bdellovibrionales bacterium]